jgi:pentose-5-phosphate-3-epimerase
VDVHVLVDEPRWLLPDVVATGPAVVTVHAEATRHLHRVLQELAAVGAAQDPPVLRGVAMSPGTPVRAIGPVRELVDLVLALAIYDGIDPPATCAALDQLRPAASQPNPSLAEEEAHVHQRHTPDRPAANPYEDHPDRRGSP